MTNATTEKRSEKKDEKYTSSSRSTKKKGAAANPFSLPSHAQLLSYWHYRNSAKPAADTWRVRHTWFDEEEAATRAAEARKRDVGSAALMKELQAGSTQKALSKSRYVRDIRQLSIWRLILGQKRDGCIQLDQQIDIEYQKYLQLKTEYRECVKALEEFLARDHEASMAILSRADRELQLTAELSDRRNDLSRRYGHVRLEVYHWEEAWRTVRACHQFLHRVSPLGAIADDDDDEDGADHDHDHDDENAVAQDAVSAKLIMSSSDLGRATSLDSLIAAFDKEAIALSSTEATSGPSALGLVEAGDLLALFRDIELQNLNALIHLDTLVGPMDEMIVRIEVAEAQVNHQIEDVLDDIRQLEKAIEIEERRAQRLEGKANRLIQRQFRALICSEEALRVRVLVEEAYESCVGANEAGLEPLAMAGGLENAYERLSAELDALPRHLVAICEREGFRQEMRENREAEDAAEKYELMHRLLGALRRIMEQTKEPKRRMLVRRSRPMRKGRARKKENLASSKQDPRDFIGGACAKRNDSLDSSSDDD